MSRLSRARERLQQEIEGISDDTTKNVVTLRSVKNEPSTDHGR
jgi:RNA polymerase sigma-70 factor (ECF subfamily)